MHINHILMKSAPRHFAWSKGGPNVYIHIRHWLITAKRNHISSHYPINYCVNANTCICTTYFWPINLPSLIEI